MLTNINEYACHVSIFVIQYFLPMNKEYSLIYLHRHKLYYLVLLKNCGVLRLPSSLELKMYRLLNLEALDKHNCKNDKLT